MTDQQPQFDFDIDQDKLTLELIEKRILQIIHYKTYIREEENNLKLKGIKLFWVLDYARQDSYKFQVFQDDQVTIYVHKDVEAKFQLKQLLDILDKIDEKLQNSETSHKFISLQEIQQAQNGNIPVLKQIFYDLFNDELRRIELFKILNIPEPYKKI